MNVYYNKRRWKFMLYGSAAIAFFILIYYSSILIKRIANEERNRIEIWADAVTYKAELVKHTEAFFEKIRFEEGKRATILAQAMQKVNEVWDEDITFYQNIISSNSTIPSIIVGENQEIDAAVNVDPSIAQMKYIWELGEQIREFDSIKIQYYANQYVVLYYKESQIYTDLRIVLNNLIESFFQEVVINSASVPVIVTDETEKHVIAYGGNLDSAKVYNSKNLPKLIEKMKSENTPIKIELPGEQICYVFYENSDVLRQLRLFPFFQFFIVLLFVGVGYLLFSEARKSEQDQVWVGMSKETAHQLGTPISSLMAWNEILKEMDVDKSIITEIDKDVHRLETIAQRFSKIGSIPELKDENLIIVIQEFLSYLQTRISKKIEMEFIYPKNKEIVLPLNRYLFEWVIENLCKNAVDAMAGKGSIFIEILEEPTVVHVDIRDTGKGIPQNRQKTIFIPGYTSKERGWGLGLTLAKRIIKEYHDGKLFVKSSTIDVGTVMRITLKKHPKRLTQK